MKRYMSYPPEKAADFIEQWEGFKETAYRCPAGKLTIGFGHTGSDVKEGDTITYHEAYDLLIKDLKRYIDGMSCWVEVPVTEGQFIALTSLAYNIGVYNFVNKCPNLRRKLNAGDYEGAAKEFLDINKVNGEVLHGLTRRRQAEAKLFLEGIDEKS